MIREAVIQAEAMLTAFARADASHFDLTLKTLSGEKEAFRRNVSVKSLVRTLSDLLETAEREPLSIIVRPRSKNTTFFQLDDINENTAASLTPYSCCVLETSDNNYQVFIAVSGLTKSNKERVRHQLVDKAKADAGASGAARLAGSLNVKVQHRRPDGSYPRVRMLSPGQGRIFSVPELIAGGLIEKQVARVPAQSGINAPRTFPRRQITPSYEKARLCVRPKEDGTTDRSAVDLLFAVTCLDWEISPRETIKLLRRYSDKAAERTDDYVAWTVAKAHKIVARRISLKRRSKNRNVSS